MAQLSLSPKASPSQSAVHDHTEETCGKFDRIQKFLSPQLGNMTHAEEKEKAVIRINAATLKHSELQIRTLRDAPRDPDKLREILKIKKIEYEKAEDSEDIEKLVTEIEMFKFVRFLANRNRNSNSS
jgi:hypothetical protein